MHLERKKLCSKQSFYTVEVEILIVGSIRSNVTILITKPPAEYCRNFHNTSWDLDFFAKILKALQGIDPRTSCIADECHDHYTSSVSTYKRLIFHVI